MDASYAKAKLRQLRGLILHERNEWADDERGAATSDGGQLVAEGLSGTRGHHK